MWHFKYPLAGGETYDHVEKDEAGRETLRETRDYISIATTRPETMLGDGAVAVHPSDARYAAIVGKLCEIPVGPKAHRRLIPIITDEYPDPNFGSGAVKITGAHDFNDYAVAQRNDIPKYRLMDTRGAMRADGAPYAEAATRAREIARGAEATEAEIDTLNLVPEAYRGLDRFEARKAVVADIDAEGLMLGVEAKKIMQPFGDRSKVVVEPMLTDQWFVDAKTLAQPALAAVRDKRITILPERDEKVYFHWLENIEPWCISRQLWWGHRVPVWYGLDLGLGETNPVDPADEAAGDLDEVDLLGLLVSGGMLHAGEVMHCAADFDGVRDAFFEEIQDTPHPIANAAIVEVADKAAAIHLMSARLADYAVNQDPTHLVYPVWRDPDVLDTWFSSGLWPIGTLGWPEDTEALKKYFPPTQGAGPAPDGRRPGWPGRRNRRPRRAYRPAPRSAPRRLSAGAAPARRRPRSCRPEDTPPQSRNRPPRGRPRHARSRRSGRWAWR
jgi:valyl-tRNA synthetase